MGFEINRQQQNGKDCFLFAGNIDEDAKFLDVKDMPEEAVIDLKGVQAINSVGIRSWIMWFSEHSATRFIFQNCGRALVMQMNMVEGFLPTNSQVASFEVPFFCEDCDKEIEAMFNVGKEVLVENGNVRLNYDKASVCGNGCDPELDVNESKYFRFLQQAGSQAA